MQRHTPDGVILACDFCATDWDMVKPMIEGHKGSILCIDCLAKAIDAATVREVSFTCTLCIRGIDAGEKAWASGDAIVCYDCLQQADRAFDKDPDTDWVRRIPPSERWR